jgi:hypothetical protein
MKESQAVCGISYCKQRLVFGSLHTLHLVPCTQYLRLLIISLTLLFILYRIVLLLTDNTLRRNVVTLTNKYEAIANEIRT